MAHSMEHLTNTQISAYLDQELAASELAACTAHLQTCQQCQGIEADLRLTSRLVRQLPKVEVPRSFVLPLNIAVLPDTSEETEFAQKPALPASTQPASTLKRAEQATRGTGRFSLKSAIRTLSTIAAVAGLFLVLAGMLSVFTSNNYMSATTSSSSSQTYGSMPAESPKDSKEESPASVQATNTENSIREDTPTVSSTSSPTLPVEQDESTQPSLPPVDFDQPETRLGLGAFLFLAGLTGMILTRRKRTV